LGITLEIDRGKLAQHQSGAQTLRIDSPPHARDQARRLQAEQLMIAVIVVSSFKRSKMLDAGGY
jgi:hypothetical protein